MSWEELKSGKDHLKDRMSLYLDRESSWATFDLWISFQVLCRKKHFWSHFIVWWM